MRKFEHVDGQMLIGGARAVDIVKRFGSPIYVTDEDAVRENYRAVYGAFAKRMPTRINYACKANTNLAILRILEQEGSCIDAVSIGEVETCLRAGFSPDRILYTGVNVSNDELRAVSSKRVPINVDSLSELERLSKITTELPLSFRVNPEVGSGHSEKVITGAKSTKFGVPKHQIIDAYARALELGFRPKGLHAHIGSGGQAVEPFIRMTEVLVTIAQELESKLGIELEFIDIGGGIGIPYRPEESVMDLDLLAEEVTGRIKAGTTARTIVVEPGRYIIADSTVLLATVVDLKDTPDKKFAGTDAGFNNLVRPAFYGSYHRVAVANKFDRPAEAKYDIVGPICETGDHIAKDRELPKLDEGDIIVAYDAGAYGFTMSSNYNMRPLCREVLVHKGEMNLIREKQTLEDLLRQVKVPSRLLV
ncbi:diaminopimelate decarboxylase [Methanomassiliicoccus luminyensis]|uniref:diaminopimelate decarboxylase n=1 Tax=Methanomassiliicoccus luminyensis TaxID=1080712 RepID=UPI000381DB83|nr:diaminopimelate decarboxylase [Methanomassiliicoccus luminyensis]